MIIHTPSIQHLAARSEVLTTPLQQAAPHGTHAAAATSEPTQASHRPATSLPGIAGVLAAWLPALLCVHGVLFSPHMAASTAAVSASSPSHSADSTCSATSASAAATSAQECSASWQQQQQQQQRQQQRMH
jgi:hypothetical protein